MRFTWLTYRVEMSRSVKLDTESLRERQARAQEADRISHDDPTSDPDEREDHR